MKKAIGTEIKISHPFIETHFKLISWISINSYIFLRENINMM